MADRDIHKFSNQLLLLQNEELDIVNEILWKVQEKGQNGRSIDDCSSVDESSVDQVGTGGNTGNDDNSNLCEVDTTCGLCMKFAYLRTGDHCSKRHITTMAPKTARREMTVAQKGIILVLSHLDYKITTISEITGRPWSAIKNFLFRAKTKGSLHHQPRSGRPPKLSKQDRRAIIRCVKSNRTWTREQVRQQCCPHVCIRTLDQYLHNNGLRKWIAKKRPKLTPERAAKRLAWALERKDWSAEQFQGTIWSDEC